MFHLNYIDFNVELLYMNVQMYNVHFAFIICRPLQKFSRPPYRYSTHFICVLLLLLLLLQIYIYCIRICIANAKTHISNYIRVQFIVHKHTIIIVKM